MKKLNVILLIVFALILIAHTCVAQHIDKDYERTTVFIENNFPIGWDVIAQTQIKVVKSENSTEYFYFMKHDGVITKFTFQDIRHVLLAIRNIGEDNRCGEYTGENNFIIGKNQYDGKATWYIVINNKASTKFYIIQNIDDFAERMRNAAIVLLDYMYEKRK